MVYQMWKYSAYPPIKYPLMSTFKTPHMKDIFSRAVTVLVSFQRLPILSTLSRIRFLYFSSCSSAGGTRRRHSSTTRSFACDPLVFKTSRCFRTFSVCAERLLCSFSSC